MTDRLFGEPAPQTYEEHLEKLRSINHAISNLQFRLGYWALETLERYGGTCQDLADDIHMPKSTLHEYVSVRRFWRLDDCPHELQVRYAHFKELQQRDNILTYTHFRNAMRVGKARKELSRPEQVEIALQWLDDTLDMKFSQMEALALPGNGQSAIVWDSVDYSNASGPEILEHVRCEMWQLIEQGKQWRVVVYEVASDD